MNNQNRFYAKVKHEDTFNGLAQAVPRCIIADSDWHLNQAMRERMLCIRLYYGVQRTTIAKVLGTTYRQCLRYETGNSAIPVSVASSLAYFYNLNLDFICGLSDVPQKLYAGEPVDVNGCKLTDCWGQLHTSDVDVYALPTEFHGGVPAFGLYPQKNAEN